MSKRIFIPVLLAASLCAPASAQQPLPGPPAGQPSAPTASPARDAGGTVSLEVSANADWSTSGIAVKAGETVRVRAWGRVRIADANGNFATPDGLDGYDDPLKLMKDEPTCALIAAIGDESSYVRIGRDAEFTAQSDGTLFFGINQNDPTGNSGAFQVRVTIGERGGLSFGSSLPPALADAAPASRSVTSNERAIDVSSKLDWTNTAISVKVGDTIVVEASGLVSLDLAGTQSGPDGINRPDADKIIPDKPTGALVAVIGIDNNDFIYVGSKTTFKAARSGLLFLGVNESDLTNNSGAFSARVIVGSSK